MTKQREALQMALDALENCTSEYGHRCNRCDSEVDEGGKVIAAIREALAEQEQEPVAWLNVKDLQELARCNHQRIGADSPKIWFPNAPDFPQPELNLVAVYTHPAPSQQAVGVPDGYKLVPIEPTQAMLDAAGRASMRHMIDCINDPKFAEKVGSEEYTRKTWASRYKSMLAAAPEAPAWQGLTPPEQYAVIRSWKTTDPVDLLDAHAAALRAKNGATK